MKMKLGIGLAFIHLILVATGAAQWDLASLGWAGRALDLYGSASGSSSSYSFFAPDVGSPLRASFDITDDRGGIVTESLGENSHREVDLRVSSIIEIFSDEVDNESERRSLAASWAGTVLSRHPRARSIRVRLEQYELPTMRAFRQGESARWLPFYKATFVTRKS